MYRFTLITFLTLFLVSPVFSDQFKGNADFTSTYESTGGLVTFPHGLHAEKISKKCNYCHSALRTFGGVSQMYGHKICKFCHESNNGPEKCAACHDESVVKVN